MNCAECGGKTAVFQTRIKKDLPGIWRTRICNQCRHRVLTHETLSPDQPQIMLTKKMRAELSRVAEIVAERERRALHDRSVQEAIDSRREIENLLEERALGLYDEPSAA